MDEDTIPNLKLPPGDRRLAFPQILDALAPRFEILAEVARGGMGAVYRARQKALDREVAIKVVLPWASSERFLREAKLLARVQSPHIVAVHDCEVLPDGTPVLVMEWIEGNDLQRTMKAHGGFLTERAALPLMKDTARGMLDAAEEGIVHRDLKPSNILVGKDGRAKVVDFGLARGPAVDVDISITGEVLGTPFYMAPELWEDPRGIDTRADIYSFGATFYHAMTGAAPFKGQSAVAILFCHKTEPVISPRSKNPSISEATSELVERCLAKKPKDRFRSFAEVLRHLEAADGGPSPWEALDEDEPGLAGPLARFKSRREAYLLRLMTPAEVDNYDFPGRRVIRILRGDIVEQPVEALVSSDDGSLTMSAGVSKAIRTAAGPGLVEEARRYAPVRAGRAIVTSAGELRAKYVFHGITLEFTRDHALRPSRDLISEIMASCIYHADSLYVEKIAFPLLGTGTAGFPEDVCLDTMFRFLARLFLHRLTAVREASIVLYP